MCETPTRLRQKKDSTTLHVQRYLARRKTPPPTCRVPGRSLGGGALSHGRSTPVHVGWCCPFSDAALVGFHTWPRGGSNQGRSICCEWSPCMYTNLHMWGNTVSHSQFIHHKNVCSTHGATRPTHNHLLQTHSFRHQPPPATSGWLRGSIVCRV